MVNSKSNWSSSTKNSPEWGEKYQLYSNLFILIMNISFRVGLNVDATLFMCVKLSTLSIHTNAKVWTWNLNSNIFASNHWKLFSFARKRNSVRFFQYANDNNRWVDLISLKSTSSESHFQLDYTCSTKMWIYERIANRWISRFKFCIDLWANIHCWLQFAMLCMKRKKFKFRSFELHLYGDLGLKRANRA